MAASHYSLLFRYMILLLISFISLSLQVDIELIDGWNWGRDNFICQGIQPGECCIGREGIGFSGAYRSVNFHHLTALDIAAVWQRRLPVEEQKTAVGWCSGSVMASRTGPGTWEWKSVPPGPNSWGSPASGASYITMPARFPVDKQGIVALTIEGVLGFVWVSDKAKAPSTNAAG